MNYHFYSLLFATYLLAIPITAHSASALPPKENIHYIAEHLVEAAQDARYFDCRGLQQQKSRKISGVR